MRAISVRWSFACLLLAGGVASAQFGREAVWTTGGSNAQRSAWVRTDGSINKEEIGSEFQLLWKVKLDKTGSPSEPILMDRYIGYRGFRSFAFMADGDGVYAVDTDLNRMEWQKHFGTGGEQKNCGVTAGLTLAASADIPGASGAGGFGGRGAVAKSGVGEPYEGAVTLRPTAQQGPPRPPAMPRPAGMVPPKRQPIVLYTVTSDGMFHTEYVSNGDESEPAVRLVQAGYTARGLIVVNHVAYAVAGPACKAAEQVVALNLETKEVLTWSADGAAIAGSEGPAMGPDGTVYVATGKGSSSYASSVVALDGKTLKPTAWYSVAGEEFTSTPSIFRYKKKVFAAATTKDGRVHVLDTALLGGDNHQSAVSVSTALAGVKSFDAGSLVVWQDTSLVHWLVASAEHSREGGVVAWKLVEDAQGAPVLQTGWSAPEVRSPSAPLVINGVVFAASGGSSSSLYALDAATGQRLWNSKAGMGAPVATLSAGAGHVYATTTDGTLFAFGFPMEH